MKQFLRNIVLLLSVGFLLLGLNGCKKCGKSPGSPAEQNIQLNPFLAIHNYGNIEIKLIPDSSFQMRVISQDGIIDNFSYDYELDTLNLYNENKCGFMNGYDGSIQVEIGVGSLRKLILERPTQISCSDTLRGEYAELVIRECEVNGTLLLDYQGFFIGVNTSTSTLAFQGKVNNLYIDERSFSKIDAFDLHAKNIGIKHYGNSIVQIHPLNSLEAEIAGSGILEYKGDPSEVEIEYIPNTYGSIRKVD